MKVRVIAGAAAVLIAGAFGVGVAAIGAGAGTRSGTEHVVLIGNFTSRTQAATFLGPVSGTGTDVSIDDHHDKVTLAHGTIFLRHYPSSDHQSVDRKNCVFSQVETGTYTITGGTGAYSHVHGSGSYQGSFQGQGCDQNKPPAVSSTVVEASGPISLG